MSHLFLARQLSTYWCTGHFFFPKRRSLEEFMAALLQILQSTIVPKRTNFF